MKLKEYLDPKTQLWIQDWIEKNQNSQLEQPVSFVMKLQQKWKKMAHSEQKMNTTVKSTIRE